MHNLYVLFFLLFSFSFAGGQSLKIDAIATSCVNAETRLDFSSTETFASDNKFSVDLSLNYGSSVVKTYPATVKNGKIVFVISEYDFQPYQLGSQLQARITSTKPSVQSPWSAGFYAYIPARVTLTGASVQAVNPGDPASLLFDFVGSYPITGVFTDSTKFTITNGYSGYGTATETVTPQTTTTYRIAHLSNQCGAGSGSGEATVQVNPISLRTTSVNTPQLCIGSELRVGYSALGSFNATNRFKIRLTGFSSSTSREDLSRTYDLDATLDNGVLKATIPSTISGQTGWYNAAYSVRIVSSSPAAIGDYAGNRIEIRPAPAAEFQSGSGTINVGQSASISLAFQGLPPFSAELSDGTVIKTTYDYTGSSSSVKPLQTTTYTIASFQSGCGSVPAKTTGSVIIGVNTGISIDSVTSGPICEGKLLRVRFSHNLALKAGNQFLVRFRYAGSVTSLWVPAQQQGDYLTFTVPTTQLPESIDSRNQNIALQISTTQPEVLSEWKNGLSVLTYPSMTWSANNQYVIDQSRQQVFWNWSARGGAPYQIEMENGQVWGDLIQSGGNVSGGTLTVPGVASATFRVKAIRNPCFTTNNPTAATLTVKSTPERFIYVRPYKQTICRGDSLELDIQAIGTFQADNQFRIQARSGSSCCEFPNTWATVAKDGKVKIKLPDTFGWYSTGETEAVFRIASTNPVIFSDDLRLAVHQPPYNVRFGDSDEVQLTQPTTISGSVSYLGGSPITINYSVNGTDYSVTSSQWYNTDISFPVNQSSTFVLKSLTNACSAVPGNRTIQYKLLPYTLQINALRGSSYETATYCAGSSLSLPYQMVGKPDPNASFSVQIRTPQAATFRTILTNARTNPLVVTVPDTLSEGEYVVRIVSNLNIVSNEQSFRIRRKATAQLTSNTGAPFMEISPDGYSYLKVDLAGSPAWTVLFSDGNRATYTSTPASYYVKPDSKTTYSLQTVINSCGYGSTTGTVAVTVKPSLSVNIASNTVCKGAPLSVAYTVQGDLEAGNRVKVGIADSPSTTNIRWLDSTNARKGTFTLSLPSSLTLGTHYLRLTTTSPAQTAYVSLQLITTPSVSIGGSAIVNPQQSATIRLKANPIAGNIPGTIRYTLSTGATGEFYGYSTGSTYDITVQPPQTTTYQLTSVSNTCGTGQATGSATVTVNPLTDRQITTRDAFSRNGTNTLCSNDTIQVPFDTKGTFSTVNRFTVQLSDSTGSHFTALPTFGSTSPLKALLPANLPPSSFYRVRVIASDNGTSSSTSLTPLQVRYSATAAFESSTLAFEPGKSTKVKINLTGDAPWTIQLGNEFNPTSTFYTSFSPYTLDVTPTSALNTYKLYRVSNVCGVGKLMEPSLLQIGVLTATEPASLQLFSVYPNPTSGWLHVDRKSNSQSYELHLSDQNGRVLLQKRVSDQRSEHDLSTLPGGLYLLQLNEGSRSATYRILKQ